MMNIPEKKLKNTFTMPAIGKGTWMPSHRKKNNPYLHEELRVEEIRATIDSGVFYIDTAERYANGDEERIIGKVLKDMKNYERKDLFLTSKVSSNHVGYDDLILAVKWSIKRMASTYIDLYFIHEYNPRISLKETMRAMDHLVESKKIKYIGVCNFTIEQLKEAQSYTKNNIVANQIHYSFTFQSPEQAKLIEYCQENDIMIIAWRPFKKESLSEKSNILLNELADKYKKSQSQIAYKWISSQKNMIVLSKLTTEHERQEAYEALSIPLSVEDMKQLSMNDNNN